MRCLDPSTWHRLTKHALTDSTAPGIVGHYVDVHLQEFAQGAPQTDYDGAGLHRTVNGTFSPATTPG